MEAFEAEGLPGDVRQGGLALSRKAAEGHRLCGDVSEKLHEVHVLFGHLARPGEQTVDVALAPRNGKQHGIIGSEKVRVPLAQKLAMLAVDPDRNGRQDRVAEDAGPFDVGDGLPLLRGEGDAVVDDDGDP